MKGNRGMTILLELNYLLEIQATLIGKLSFRVETIFEREDYQ